MPLLLRLCDLILITFNFLQMSPDVFSPEAKNWGFQTSLQERLFYEYKQLQAEETFDSNLIFLTENYRSNEQLLQLASDMFYGGKLSAGSNQPLHPSFGPFMFFCALGKEEMEANHFSFRNLAEVSEIVRRVRELADSWPEEWGAKDLKQVAVVSSYHYQVLIEPKKVSFVIDAQGYHLRKTCSTTDILVSSSNR